MTSSTPQAEGSAELILTLSCADQPGIVYAVSRFLTERGATIVESQQFNDRVADTFFMRVQFAAADGRQLDPHALRGDFEAVPWHWSAAPGRHHRR